jgi:hypothetical protein
MSGKRISIERPPCGRASAVSMASWAMATGSMDASESLRTEGDQLGRVDRIRLLPVALGRLLEVVSFPRGSGYVEGWGPAAVVPRQPRRVNSYR